MAELGHQQCYIANTLSAELILEPAVSFTT